MGSPASAFVPRSTDVYCHRLNEAQRLEHKGGPRRRRIHSNGHWNVALYMSRTTTSAGPIRDESSLGRAVAAVSLWVWLSPTK